MKNAFIIVWVELGLICGLAVPATAKNTACLFTYFIRNGEDGLHLAWSRDGYKWEALNGGASCLAPTGRVKLIRDPCVVCGPDGTYHMVWTSGGTGHQIQIGYASTKDFRTWSEQKEIPVMAHEPTTRNAWAPEAVWDEKRKEFIVFWASTVPEKFNETAGASERGYNHRMYFTTTKDFVSFTPTRLFYNPGFSVIDATVLSADGRYYLIVKDETLHPPKKHLRIAVSDDLRGPFTGAAVFTAGLVGRGSKRCKNRYLYRGIFRRLPGKILWCDAIEGFEDVGRCNNTNVVSRRRDGDTHAPRHGD